MTGLAVLLGLTLTRLTLTQGELIEVRQNPKPLDIAKQSPLKFPPNNKPYEFEWLTEGYARPWKSTNEAQLRFRIFSQDRKAHNELAIPTAQLLLRLWSYNYTELKIDHKPDYNHSCVDVYLCFAGDPGGEQLFDEDRQAKGISTKVNTIYIYDLPSFKDPLEKLREVCHEYGHASLPAIGGYDNPEYWANGYLGEKFFMTWLAKQPNITADQLYGCEPAVLKNWLEKICNPMISKAATNFPSAAWMTGKTEEHMNRYIGLMLWMQLVMPPRVMAQSMKIIRTYNPKDVPDSLVDASDGVDGFTFTVPSYLVGKKIWLPFGRLKVSGATITGKSGGWISVTAPKTAITVR